MCCVFIFSIGCALPAMHEYRELRVNALFAMRFLFGRVTRT